MSDEPLRRLLAQPKLGGVYRLPVDTATLHTVANAAGWLFRRIDLRESPDLERVLTSIGSALEFPEWFGNNLDALHDCLTDLSWLDAPGYLLVVTGSETLQASAPTGFSALTAVFAAAAGSWHESGVPFWVFIDQRADGLTEIRPS